MWKGVRARINFNLLYGPWIKLVLEIRAYKQRALLIKGFAEIALLQAVPLYVIEGIYTYPDPY